MGPDDAIDLFFLHDLSENYIDGCAFVMLNEHDVRELVTSSTNRTNEEDYVLCTSSEFFR